MYAYSNLFILEGRILKAPIYFRYLPALLAALVLTLSACSKQDVTPAAAEKSATPAAPAAASKSPGQTYDTVAAQGKGFTVGAVMAAHTVYVLFDPQCPHCGHLWNAALPLQKKAKFVWIPVAIMNGKSATQGAALITSTNPADVMTAHEASILAGTGGMIASGGASAEIEDAIKANTKLFTSLGVESVPFIVAKNSQTGLAVTHNGAMETAALAGLLGLTAP